MRGPLLRRGSRARGRAGQKLNALPASKLATVRASDPKETFHHLWHYRSVLGGPELFWIIGATGRCAVDCNG
ncbi:MAG: hypothetical protein ACRD3T_01585 [Terriglobia bacterium]